MVLIYREEDEARKKDLESKFKNENFPTFLKNMETLVVTRGGKHFAGSEVLFVLHIYEINIFHMYVCNGR